MAVTFDPATGLTVDSAADVLAQIEADWQNAFSGGGLPPLDVDPATPAGQLIATQAALVHRLAEACREVVVGLAFHSPSPPDARLAPCEKFNFSSRQLMP